MGMAGAVSHNRFCPHRVYRGGWTLFWVLFVCFLEYFFRLVELGEEKRHLSLVKGHQSLGFVGFLDTCAVFTKT